MVLSKKFRINLWGILSVGLQNREEIILPKAMTKRVANFYTTFQNEMSDFCYDARSF